MYRTLASAAATLAALIGSCGGALAEQADPTFNASGRYIYGETGQLDFRAVATLPLPNGKVVSVFRFPPFTGFCAEPKCISLALFSAEGVLERVATYENGIEEVTAAAVDGSGRIVVVARTNSGATGRDIHVARFLPSLLQRDLSFAGGTGWANFSFNASDEYPSSVAIDRADRIIVAGTFTFSPTDTDFGITVLKSNGTLDTSFNGTGHRPVAFDLSASGLRFDAANAVAVADNGDIIAIGNVYDAAASRIRVGITRLKSNGSFDTGFCSPSCGFNAGFSSINQGRTVYQFGAATPHADEGAAIDAFKGGYVIAGTTYADDGSNRRAVLARFTDGGAFVSERIAQSLGDNGTFNGVKAVGGINPRFIAVGNSGPDNNFLMIQAFDSNLGNLAGYGNCQPNNNGFCPIFASNLADWGPDVGRAIAIDARGRPLLAAQGIASEGGKAALMTARYTNDSGPLPDVIFRTGFN